MQRRNDIFNATAGSGVAVSITERIFPSIALNSYIEKSNSLFLQNLPSALVAHVLNVSLTHRIYNFVNNLFLFLKPKPGEKIFDMCAAPGGKTSHLAQLMKNSGLVVAAERSKKRMQEIIDLCNRLQLSNVKTIAIDSTKILKV